MLLPRSIRTSSYVVLVVDIYHEKPLNIPFSLDNKQPLNNSHTRANKGNRGNKIELYLRARERISGRKRVRVSIVLFDHLTADDGETGFKMNKIRIGPQDKDRVEEVPGNSVIVLHQFPRTSTCASPSPYPIKVETFLRMNKIDYISDFKNFIGAKGKCPWITDTDGQAIVDSESIIEHLTE